nr:MAG TPA: hypothetical protein [Caudoviricetes sp.]
MRAAPSFLRNRHRPARLSPPEPGPQALPEGLDRQASFRL